MTWQQFAGQLEGLRRALAGGTPDADGVLWNTDGAAQYIANVVDAVGLGATIAAPVRVLFTATDFDTQVGAIALAQRSQVLQDVEGPALLTGALVAVRSPTDDVQCTASIYVAPEGDTENGDRLLAFLADNSAIVPTPDGPGTLLTPFFSTPLFPAWIYPRTLTGRAAVAMAVTAAAQPVPADLEVEVALEVVRNVRLPLSPPFPR